MAATLEGALNHFIANCPLVVSVHHLMTKWRIQLKGGYALDFYFNATSGKYSYTLSQNDNRVLGWDNARIIPTSRITHIIFTTRTETLFHLS